MTVYLPLSVQNKLKCSLCKKHLSVFPIYTDTNTNESICGRCSPPEQNDNLFRNKLYEEIASNNKFVCCFKRNGCIEYLFPSEVANHEKYCKYRKYDCALGKDQCTWQGVCGEFLEHFEQNHNIFILQDGKFEVDFVNSHDENYLLPFGDELFVVSRKAESKTKKFILKVNYIGKNYFVDNYYYVLTFKSANGEHTHKVVKKVNTVCEFGGEDLSKLLKNPGMIVAQIDIQDKENVEENGDNDASVDENDYEDLNVFECPTCFEYLLPPIYQCDIGHSICGKCKDDNSKNKCPTCEAPFGKTRNFALENIILKVTYPCKFPKCKFSCKARDISQHQATCIYGPYTCPLNDILSCQESMPITEIYEHIETEHYESLLEFDVIDTPFEGALNGFDECYVLRHSLSLFRLVFRFDDRVLYWSMQMIGQTNECVKFKFEIDFGDNENENRVYLKGPCAPFCDISTCFAEGKSFLYLDFDQVSMFITEKLFYRVRILLD